MKFSELAHFVLGTELLLRRQDRRAFDHFSRSAIEGFPLALAVVGFFFEFGLGGLVVDYASAERYYVKAAEKNCGFAQTRLAFLKVHGRPDVKIDHLEALKWKIAANRQGEASITWLRKAADANLPEAQLCLGLCYYNGIVAPENDEKAFQLFSAAANAGNPCAQNMLGNLLIEGTGCEKNPDVALEWYIKAAERREAAAIHNIGTLFERGIAVNEDMGQAFEWYLRAANHGSIVALNVLGIFYEQGFAVNQDPSEAIKWYTKAAHCGHPHAQYNLARCYHDGFGVAHNDALALRWFEAAAKQRHALSQLSTAVCYEFGIGSNVHIQKSYHYYIEAAKNGSEPAKKRLRPVIATDILRVTRAYVNSHTLPIEPHVYRTDSKFFEDEKLVASLHQANFSNDQLETMRLQVCLKSLPIEIFFKIILHLDAVHALRPSQIFKIYDFAVQSRRFHSVSEFTEALGVTEIKVRCINANANVQCKHVGHVVSMLQLLE